MKLVLPFFVYFNRLKIHIGDMDKVLGTKGWPIDEL